MMMMMIYSARLSLKGTSTIYMGSIPPVPPWSRDSPYVRFERFFGDHRARGRFFLPHNAR